MTVDELRRLLVAPEIVVVDLLRHALHALRLALLAEHPALANDLDAADDPPIQARARALLRNATRLRRALHAYRRAVYRLPHAPADDDLPF
jgi:hypothetical protein